MRLPALIPLLAFLTALPARAMEADPPKHALPSEQQPDDEEEAIPEDSGDSEATLATETLGARREAVLLTSPEVLSDEGVYVTRQLDARLVVLNGEGPSRTVLSRQFLRFPGGSGSHEASIDTSLTGKKGEKVIEVMLGRHSDGEGKVEEVTFFQVSPGEDEEGGQLSEILRLQYTPSSGSGYPHEKESLRSEAKPSPLHEGYSDLFITLHGKYCETDEDCRETERVTRIRWTGTHYEQQEDRRIRVSASSSLSHSTSRRGPTYDAGNVRDEDKATAWCEGAKGTGSGEWLAFSFDMPVTVQQLTLIPGYNKSPEVWRNNARLKQVRLHFEEGPHQDVTLEDSPAPQHIRIARKSPFKGVKLEILSVYPGKRFADACVSEVDFSGVRAAPVRKEAK
ncbi:hypothetical protein HPC49_32465 [Pyxidicoccus fallax]|uniref:NAD glycohydrolase translocation F5/8 type C domain-containing protein n=1 Tax=Pyxidicoccus fallax TaxID=394095 RepID=A0A848LW66_9BACT|nr:hypothetical protein [Pyxidicoccus fallax]NMO21524.1 hypothetical protein [Pyxidicoccus fallax]NPC82924.1 hypothetical protein [Pyxidicoccus fallax]